MRDEPDNKGATRRLRLLSATAIAPWSIIPVLAAWIFLVRFDAVLGVVRGDRYFFESLIRYLTFLVQWFQIGIGPAYALTILYGIPVHFAFKRLEVRNLIAFLVAGVLGGVLLALLFNFGPGYTSLMAACGAVVAVTFRAIVVN